MDHFIEQSASTWQRCYHAAVLENDKAKAANLIAFAERVIVTRVRSLFHKTNVSLQERNSLDAALQALHVLKRYSQPKNRE
jgi:hypothetical protein